MSSVQICWKNLPFSKKAKLYARKISATKWILRGALIFRENDALLLDYKGWREVEFNCSENDKGGALLKLSSVNAETRFLNLGRRPGHPSINILPTFEHLDFIEFRFKNALGKGEKSGVGIYLELKQKLLQRRNK
jgi:hypothetical protein